MIHILYSCLCLCGSRKYHNIVPWNYGELLKVFGSNQSSPTQTYRATKEEELGNLLDTRKIRDKGCLQLVEVVVPRDDAPSALKRALKKDVEMLEMNMNTIVGDTIYKKPRLGLIGW
jgi:TPP-dependent 2-oxoacid decarboxylase